MKKYVVKIKAKKSDLKMEVVEESTPLQARPSFHQDANIYSNGTNTPKTRKRIPKKHATST